LRYVSTRGRAPALEFEDVLLTGLAVDGGLYVPESWPRLSAAELSRLAGAPYAELAVRLIGPYVGAAIAEGALADMVAEAYAGFDHRAVAPLRQLDGSRWLLELFHGPTLAFKDCALQLVARLFDHFLARRGDRVTVIGATSGDTGSAAIEACRDRDSMMLFIFHPEGRVSEVQRRQMTTVVAANVHNVAIQGNFDDCQTLVKGLFADAAFRAATRLAAVNSINWARVMAQVVYYVYAALALGGPARAVAFAVPTGNFGNAYAGFAAQRMGLPVRQLVVATNRNDVLARFFAEGTYRPEPVVPSMSPSMDIQRASNFERLLFELTGRDGDEVAALMASLDQSGAFTTTSAALTEARALFTTRCIDEAETMATIARTHAETGTLVDPHTAVGIAAGSAAGVAAETPLVCLATAHPAKFPEAVVRATGLKPSLPAQFADLFEREERYDVLTNDLEEVKAYVRERI